MASPLFETIRNTANESLWDWHSFQTICEYVHHVRYRISNDLPSWDVFGETGRCTVSPCNQFIATRFDYTGEIFLIDVVAKKAYPLLHHTHHVKILGFSPDSTILLSASDDEEEAIVVLWNVQSRTLFRLWRFPNKRIGDCAISGEYLAVGLLSPGDRRLYQCPNFEYFVIWSLWNDQKPFSAVCTGERLEFSKNGNYLAAFDDDKTVQVWETKSFDRIAFIEPEERKKYAFQDPFFTLYPRLTSHSLASSKSFSGGPGLYSPDGRYEAAACRKFDDYGISEDYVAVWDLKSRTKLWEFCEDYYYGIFFEFSPNSKYLATSDENWNLSVHNLRTGKLKFWSSGNLLAYVNERLLYAACAESGLDGVLAVELWDL